MARGAGHRDRQGHRRRPRGGRPERCDQPQPTRRIFVPDAILVAPATYNTICKRAQGISGTYALGVLAEAIGMRGPIVVLPFVNTALASRAPFRRSVESLRADGVRTVLGPGGFRPHPPRTGDGLIDSYPRHLGLDETERMLDPAPPKP